MKQAISEGKIAETIIETVFNLTRAIVAKWHILKQKISGNIKVENLTAKSV